MPCPMNSSFGDNEYRVGPDYAEGLAGVYFNMRKVSIYGGSNEIQRNIIAKAVSGALMDFSFSRRTDAAAQFALALSRRTITPMRRGANSRA